MVAQNLRARKDQIGGFIAEFLRECTKRERDDSFHPIRRVSSVSEQIGKAAWARHERDPSTLLSYIEKLPDPDRTIIELRMAGLNYRETARRLGLDQHLVLTTLSMRAAVMASIDACAPPVKSSTANNAR
jgi:DNA-directed RNA polymerase specialized sigma24 family protein